MASDQPRHERRRGQPVSRRVAGRDEAGVALLEIGEEAADGGARAVDAGEVVGVAEHVGDRQAARALARERARGAVGAGLGGDGGAARARAGAVLLDTAGDARQAREDAESAVAVAGGVAQVERQPAGDQRRPVEDGADADGAAADADERDAAGMLVELEGTAVLVVEPGGLVADARHLWRARDVGAGSAQAVAADRGVGREGRADRGPLGAGLPHDRAGGQRLRLPEDDHRRAPALGAERAQRGAVGARRRDRLRGARGDRDAQQGQRADEQRRRGAAQHLRGGAVSS